MRGHRVQCLLMGGQACVFYGAAEFSRDTDLAILASDENLDRLKAALTELQAETIAVPDFDIAHLLRGHAVHFRCRHPEASGMRVDVMSSMGGVAPFPELWERRTTLETPVDGVVDGVMDGVGPRKITFDGVPLGALLEFRNHACRSSSHSMVND
ncbi:MAG: hypothetical protein B9S38_05650 [Verrucomicrobiia bacterium Tous-C4TDCM]|nr:MAG: hypothetical protein B9S38_05650 [Verrucomicrobiae bacterium Tous-C4TDCM]